MQPAGGGSGSGSELNRVGLHRFRSAPATWLEALLESETENDVLLDTPTTLFHHPQPQPPPPELKPSSGTGAARFSYDLGQFESGGGGVSNLVRQSSSPAEFLSQISSDGYFSGFDDSTNYDYVSGVSQSAKRHRESDSESSMVKLSSQLKVEQSGKLCSAGGSLDAEMEKLMEDLVPCKVRAKRGYATHPRSIAERVRRTRISDKIRKLQELVPNMDKQTNTSDMLDEAVEYVKFLQKEIQELTEHQKKCTCSMKEQ